MKASSLALLSIGPLLLHGEIDDRNAPLTCVFEAHTNQGTISGKCITQTFPDTEGFNVRWKLTLIPDEKSAKRASALPADRVYDMVRSQALEDGNYTLVLPLFGDFFIKPDDPEYIELAMSTAPRYETRPQEVTISRTSNAPLTLELLFEERSKDFDLQLRKPSREWILRYLDCLYRLGTNRPDGFSR
jgi:hypothetical protein